MTCKAAMQVSGQLKLTKCTMCILRNTVLAKAVPLEDKKETTRIWKNPRLFLAGDCCRMARWTGARTWSAPPWSRRSLRSNAQIVSPKKNAGCRPPKKKSSSQMHAAWVYSSKHLLYT